MELKQNEMVRGFGLHSFCAARSQRKAKTNLKHAHEVGFLITWESHLLGPAYVFGVKGTEAVLTLQREAFPVA